MLLAVSHGNDSDLCRAGGDEGFFEFGKVCALRDQRGEPTAKRGALRALGDHAAEEGEFTAFTPELVGLASEVERGLTLRAVAAAGGEIAKFARGAGGGLGGGSVKGWIAERGGEGFAGRGDVGEERAGIGLMAELDQGGDAGVGVRRDEAAGAVEGGLRDVGADEGPSVFARAEERVDAVGADADVEDAHGGAAGWLAIWHGLGEEVGEVMKIIGATGDGRAKRAGREIVAIKAVVVGEEGAVEREDGGRIGEVDRFSLDRVRHKVAGERRVGADQRRKIVAPVVTVARVQAVGGCRGRGGHGQLMSSRRGGWPGRVAGARWTQGSTGLPGQRVEMRQRLPKPKE